ncbi:MAG: hypothetical protein N3C63_08970 [Rhodocyclaceae bacterium]|nr:hypothetical protein [Rhodocyclaceae bacterium]
MADTPSLELGNSRDFGEIRAEVQRLVKAIAPGHDMGPIDAAFALIEAACTGQLDGYAPLGTPYHDQAHLMEVVLCSARLLHGLHLAGLAFPALTIDACLVGALLHDSGYLMRVEEAQGTGAQFTLTHVVRGVVFAETQLGAQLSPELLSATGKVILTTDHRPVAAAPHYDSPAERLAAQVTATADLLGQMSSREYLERLLLLYCEFREAGIASFSGFHDLLEKTHGFYQLMTARLQNELGGLTPILTRHFEASRGVARNFYAESVERNIDHLGRLVREERGRRFDYLRRGGIVERALKFLGEEPE